VSVDELCAHGARKKSLEEGREKSHFIFAWLNSKLFDRPWLAELNSLVSATLTLPAEFGGGRMLGAFI
jgi:hypothetical protein